MRESGTLLATKLRPRPLRPDLVARPRLLERLGHGLNARLVLVAAPAGFGKTTLVAAWLAASRAHVAWLSLDRADDAPSVFVRYLVAAVDRAAPGLARSASALLRAGEAPSLVALAALTNDLVACDREVVIVLDDFHLIESPAVHSAVADLLEHLPPTAHLVVVTRADPPLPLARLRSRGELLEIRAADLRFSTEEVAALLNDSMRLGLAPADVAALAERTEGWVAGLQLAALALGGQRDASALIRALGGHRFVVDFLAEEVLSRQPPGVRSFLLRTSILGRLCGALADAVAGGDDGQATLERLERENAFVAPLDDERRWYRYHQLFADLLQARLRQELPGEVAKLHARAAEWHEAHGDPGDAIGHALAASDTDRAVRLLEQHWRDVGHRGEWPTVGRWLSSLPESAAAASPILCVAAAWVALGHGQTSEAEGWLSRLDGAARGSEDAVDRRSVDAEAALLRSFLAQRAGDLPRAAVQAAWAANLADPSDSLRRGGALLSLGFVHATLGDVDRAIAAFEEGIPLSREAGNRLNAATAAAILTRTYRRKGLLRQAEAACRRALADAEADGLGVLPQVGALLAVLADLVREASDLAEAERLAERGLELGRRGDATSLLFAETALARVRFALGDLSGAAEALAVAESAAESGGPPVGAAEIRVEWARLEAAGYEMPAVDARVSLAVTTPLLDEIHALADARHLMTSGEPRRAVEVLERGISQAEAAGRLGTALDLLVLDCLAKRSLEQTGAALVSLGRALAIAAGEGFFRVFLDEGEPMLELLRVGIEADAWGEAAVLDHVRRLLDAARRRAAKVAGPSAPSTSPEQTLVEPLSERELEVIRLVAAGLANKEIAEALVISLNTVKKHTSNAFGKLGVASRTQAIARARELGLF